MRLGGSRSEMRRRRTGLGFLFIFVFVVFCKDWIAGPARSCAGPPAALPEPAQQLSVSQGWIAPRMRNEQVPASELMEIM